MTTTIRDPEAYQTADRLDEIAKALRARMRKEGIPAVRWHMSKMVRGWGDIVQAGVTVRVGFGSAPDTTVSSSRSPTGAAMTIPGSIPR